MTTIAYRDGLLAADSALTDDGESMGSVVYQCQKLYSIVVKEPGRIDRHIYVGLRGDSNGLKFIRWVRDGMNPHCKPDFPKSADFAALVVERGRVAVYGVECEPEPVLEEYHAIGSGSKCAFTAMDMGASALAAVERASARDPYTRGPFRQLECV